MTALTPVETIDVLAGPEAERRAAEETRRMVALLGALDDADWRRPTDCPAWDVRDLAGHVVGQTRAFSSHRHFVRHMAAAGRRRGQRPLVDALTEVQVEWNAYLDPDALVRDLERIGPVNARWRSGRRFLRRAPMTDQMPDGSRETWRTGYLLDVILTRDTWMHRVDLSRATGRPMELTADHDGRIVADVVADWARRHGQPFTLELAGPAGGSFVGGGGGEPINVDAVEFCRLLSLRGRGEGLLAQFVPF